MNSTLNATAALAEDTTPAKARPLWEIGRDLVGILNKLDTDEEIADDVATWLGTIEGEEAKKLDGYVNIIRGFEMQANAARAEAAVYSAAAKRSETNAAKLKALLKAHMELTQRKSIKTATGRTISVRGNGGRLPIQWAFAVDLDTVDARFTVVKKEINSDAVYEALKAGEALDFASLGKAGTNLQIK